MLLCWVFFASGCLKQLAPRQYQQEGCAAAAIARPLLILTRILFPVRLHCICALQRSLLLRLLSQHPGIHLKGGLHGRTCQISAVRLPYICQNAQPCMTVERVSTAVIQVTYKAQLLQAMQPDELTF